MNKGHVLAVVDAQYGSTGKGTVVGHVADRYDFHVRTGSANAGHTLWRDGVKHVQQMIPCGWVNRNATLILGRGALISPDVLLREIEEIKKYDPNIEDRVFIDPKAGCLDPKFHVLEGGVNGEAHKRIGSTGEGVGPAREARIHRDPSNFQLMKDAAKTWGLEHMLKENTPAILRMALNTGKNVLLEGTQGCGLSLIHGEWPFVTSNDTNAAQMAADAGIPPHLVEKVILVARTMPIRVHGNSGPLRDEVTWEQLSQELGRTVCETTTVTKKIRRIGRWDEKLIDDAVTINAPTSFAITFLDYLVGQEHGTNSLSPVAERFVKYVEARWGVPVALCGTGGQDVIIERSKDL